MRNLLDLTAPLLIGAVMLTAALRGVDLYEAMLAGARKGLQIMADILPALLVLFPAIRLLRASGLPELLVRLLSPLLDKLGVPADTVLLMLLRPISGSAALAAASEIIQRCGPDSLTGRTAAVMIGSSETTLYVAAVYFAAAGVRRSRWAIPAALCADLACFLSSAWICRALWG
ncbi:MAG: spore maturation protein [Oscillospiraceae bacterium]|nr:spore maturation protein [Oscillospiraceae bacterium]